MDALGAHSYDTLVKLEGESYLRKSLEVVKLLFLVIGHSSSNFLEMLLLFFTPYWFGICWKSLPLI